MSEPSDRDVAWVALETPLSPQALAPFLADPETLYRINSLLEIQAWEHLSSDQVRLQARNLSNGQCWDTQLRFFPKSDGLVVHYAGLLKQRTEFRIEPRAAGGSLLRITDDYSGIPETERKARLEEVDRSLPQWGRDLYAFFRAWHRWHWFPPWRWFMRRVWLPMKPLARRITRWILWIALAEFLIFLLVFAIFVHERQA